ncbi:MAG: glucose-6-phosphate dehydrogenase [Tannerellaceae bacterium]|nr:glucose-6-phosphate dehydrogenase [Tannerellaceae bacterium]
MNNQTENQLLVIFGASGDLTFRKLIPALYDMFTRKLLPEYFCILGASRTSYTNEQFRAEQHNHLVDLKGEQADMDAFLQLLWYITMDTYLSADYNRLKEFIQSLQKQCQLPDNVMYYLATPPVMYEVIPALLAANGLNHPSGTDGWRRIVVEKPFGNSLESAQKLNKELGSIFNEKDIYRIDHYLGKETVQNILVLRFSNGIFEPLWNRHYIDSVEIVAFEELGVEKRGKYYEGAGALRDMTQNHLMELMAFTAMESPPVFEPEMLRNEIHKVFLSLQPLDEQQIDKQVLRGQYEGYRQEPDVAPDSVTETWVGMKFFIDNVRWSQVPFYLYTGKKMSRKLSEIYINFKSTPHVLFAGQCSGGSCNQLIIRIQPDEGISLRFGLKMPGGGFVVKRVSMDFRYSSLSSELLPDAYVRLLMDAMNGDSTLYPRSDALEASWKFIDPILTHWKEVGGEGLLFYPPGTDGPAERDRLWVPD